MARIKYFSIQELAPNPSLGTWTESVASNIVQLAKVAQSQSPVLTFSIPRDKLGTAWGDPKIVSMSVQYAVATAALSSAPSLVFNALSMAEDTRVVSRTAKADTTTFSGTDTVGTAVGTYAVKGALDQPLELLDTESLTAEFTFPCAATTVLTLRGVLVEVA